jgi:hypothetical protein
VSKAVLLLRVQSFFFLNTSHDFESSIHTHIHLLNVQLMSKFIKKFIKLNKLRRLRWTRVLGHVREMKARGLLEGEGILWGRTGFELGLTDVVRERVEWVQSDSYQRQAAANRAKHI